WGQTGGSCEVHYSAAKAAVIGLTKALAKELGPSGIRVNCIAPGVIDTEMNAMHGPAVLHELAEDAPLERLGTSEDVANAVSFLAGEQSSFITGQVLGVNGGILI
ncbi:MAG TPA: 3-oxoacyl-ACP reductase, partial [Ruminococcaceae bacterium]|nr:3-oxoacyl-ACP reductase [Oscillospiraceae bacterium]